MNNKRYTKKSRKTVSSKRKSRRPNLSVDTCARMIVFEKLRDREYILYHLRRDGWSHMVQPVNDDDDGYALYFHDDDLLLHVCKAVGARYVQRCHRPAPEVIEKVVKRVISEPAIHEIVPLPIIVKERMVRQPNSSKKSAQQPDQDTREQIDQLDQQIKRQQKEIQRLGFPRNDHAGRFFN